MTALDTLPNEILFQIVRDSTPQELCRLSYTCQRLGLIASSCLWSDIELHEKGYHESSAELTNPAPFRAAQRPYNSSRRDGWQSDIYRRGDKLFALLQSLQVHDETRLRHLAGKVSNPISIWGLLPYFINIESLELHGSSYAFRNDDLGKSLCNARPLANLKFAKLFAYVPRDVATYVLRSNTSLERLELGMLDDPKPGNIGIDPGDNLNSHGEDMYQGGVIPRPLGGFFHDTYPSFRKLKHLHLCQPCNSQGDYFNQSNAWSARSEQSSLESCRNILMASCQTLETLVLDQRPGAGVEENEGFSEEEFLNSGSSGLGNKAVIETLGSIFTSESGLPKLNQVYLYGFIVRSPLRRRPSAETPGDKLLYGLERRGVRCEARRGKWCLFDQESGKTSWAKWDGDGCTNLHDEYMGTRWYTILAKV